MARASRPVLNGKRRSSTLLRSDGITVSPTIEKDNRQKVCIFAISLRNACCWRVQHVFCVDSGRGCAIGGDPGLWPCDLLPHIWNCQLAIESAFKESPASDSVDVRKLSAAIEEEIYKANGANIGPKYKSSMRSHLVNLKNKKNDLRERILTGEVSPQKFAVMSTEEMSTRERIKEDELLKQRNLEAHILSQNNMPSNILDVKLHDGRERGKWGVTKSAAAIDYFE
ncbi:transcription factor S-II, central domain-containing protein [Lipomyces mesembrius]